MTQSSASGSQSTAPAGALAAHRPTRFGLSRSELAYAALCTLFCVVLVLTNIVGVKLFAVPIPTWLEGIFRANPVTLTSGILSYPITFLCTDLVSELWGRRKANFMVVLGFLMSLLMLLIVELAKVLPPSPMWSNPMGEILGPVNMQEVFQVAFHTPGILLGASMTAYLIAQLFDVRLYHFWWKLTKGRHMWIRNNGSTAVSQLVDTVIVNSIFLHFAFNMNAEQIGSIILAVYLFKLALAAIDTPLIYLGRYLLRRWLGLPQDESPEAAPLA